MSRARWFLLAFLLAAPAAAQPPRLQQAFQKDFIMRFYGAFLEPGLGAVPAVPGDELENAVLTWTGPAEGRLDFSEWRQKGWAEFKTSPDRKTLTAIRTNLEAEPGKPMDVWRMRHGYRFDPARGYTWVSLEDAPPVLDAAAGAVYDRFLTAVWKLWPARRLREMLKAAGNTLDVSADPGQLEQPVRLTYDRGGLVGTPTLEFHYRYWHIPVRVRFTLRPKQPTHDDPWIIGLKGPIAFSIDKDEWRRRHGCRQGFAGAALDADFPDPAFPIRDAAPRLEEMLETGTGYWAEAAVSIIMSSLDTQLKEAVAALPAPTDRPAFLSLQRQAAAAR